MAPFFQQIFTILTTPPGVLAYNIVVAFSVAGALSLSAHSWYLSGFPQNRRTTIGLVLLLVSQALLFVVGGLNMDSPVLPPYLLPVLDRTLTAFGLILIIWLWAFPEPLRLADAASFLLGLLVLAISIFSAIWWVNRGLDTYFNGSLPDSVWGVFDLLVVVLGAVILYLRRPNGWITAQIMLALLFLGYIIHLWAPLSDNDFPGVVRLFQMLAYPLLLTLPQRFQVPVVQPPDRISPPGGGVEASGFTSELFDNFLELFSGTSPQENCPAITRILSQAISADLGLMVSIPPEGNSLSIRCGFDSIRNSPLGNVILESSRVPLLTAALHGNTSLRLPASSTSADLEGLSQALNLSRSGPLLAVPFPLVGAALTGLVFLSPYSNRGWTKQDESSLVALSDSMVGLLERSSRFPELEEQLAQSDEHIQRLQSNLETLKSQADQDQKSIEGLAALVAAQETVVASHTESKPPEEFPGSREIQHLEAELRLALEELAFTRNALAGADEKILMLERGGAPQQVPSDEAQTIASLAQELRQPLSSIISYADLLLSESVGILGALQRRFLERIKTSGERLRVIVEDLVQVAVTASSTLDLPPEPLDFSALVDEAIASVSQQVQEKELDLRLDVDEPFPAFQADRDALGQIILHLLQNACYATPRAGQVSLYARLESTGDQSGYLLIQVSDQGGGIPSQDIPHLFTRLYRSDNPLIPGVGDRGVGLSVVKTLVEAYQGRIWVDTDMGYGSTFSVLLPVMVIAGVPTSSKDQPA